MSSSAGLLDFFILEAGDYIERLDALLARAGDSLAPDAEEMAKYARMLRGSATMSRLTMVAEVAGGLERVARLMRDGTLRWDPMLRGVLTAAVDDLKVLVRGVRAWGPAEETRARARLDELARVAPVAARTAATPPAVAASAAYLSFETLEVANALDALVARPADRSALLNAVGRVRALRGVAALRDLPPLAEVVDGIERAAKPLELAAGTPDERALALFGAAAQLLRRAATELRSGGRPDPAAPEVQRFTAALAAIGEVSDDADRIVPIATLFHDDDEAHVVRAAPNPPTTPAERFRLEVVSQAEHLRRLVADARDAGDAAGRARLGRELRAALRGLERGAESFGEEAVARFVRARGAAVVSLDAQALDALEDAASLLAAPATRADELSRRLGELASARQSAPPPDAGARAAAPPPPPTPPAPRASTRPTPTGPALHALLEQGLGGFGRLTTEPLREKIPLAQPVVPIEALLYSGRGALDRAREIRDQLRGSGRTDPDALAELYDLLDLAAQD